MSEKKFRHEIKHEISRNDRLVLRSRLSALMIQDSHAVNGRYKIRSLYFDTPEDKALREKLDGVSCREKFRMRLYNNDPSVIFLEKKSKRANLCAKDQVQISKEEAQAICQGNIDPFLEDSRPLVQELALKMRNERLKPAVIVDYVREPFTYPAGNVRVTIDYDIKTGLKCTDFLNPDALMIPTPQSPIILEVKWDEFLPAFIRDAVNLNGRHSSAFSKYAASRMYG